MHNDAFLLEAARTPFGKYNGMYAHTRPDDLLATLMRSFLERTGIEGNVLDDVIMGNANGAGEENRNVARMSSLLAGLPTTVPGTTVNRLCGSSLEAAIQASRAIRAGDYRCVLAGGVESMTRAPLVLPKAAKPFHAGNVTAEGTTIGWRLVNPAMPKEWTISLGAANEELASTWSISRKRQDEFALRSHRLAAAAWEAGNYDRLVIAPGENASDESIRANSSPEALAALSPAFSHDGTITAGNSSPLSDGASLALIGSREAAEHLNLEPAFRIAATAVVGNDPRAFGIAPIEAGRVATQKAGIALSDLDAVELNEAFAVQSLICIDEWGVDPNIVNAWGGAIALGHPLGASGTRLLGTLTERMRHGNLRWGMAALCVGVGQGMAVVVENIRTRSNESDSHG